MSLPVFFGEREVGVLTRTDTGLRFDYGARWAALRSAFPVSVSLPMDGRLETDPSRALAWFWNLLPEEEQLHMLGSLLQRAPSDIYGLLEKIGRETAGALSIGGPERDGRYRALDGDEFHRILRALPARPFLADERDVTMSLAGAQSKLAVAVFGNEIHLPLGGAASTHIVKPASARLYATVENEAFCMMLAKAVGIDTPDVSVGRTGDLKYLLVKRYDRERTKSKARPVRRLHQEDAAQALGLPPTKKYEKGGGASWSDLIKLVDEHSVRKVQDRIALLDRAIFNVATHNTDAHAKNYSFFVTRAGLALAPGYDLMTSLPFPDITQNMAMTVGGANRARHILRKHWRRFAASAGYSPAGAASRAAALSERIAEAVPGVIERLARNPVVDRTALAHIAEHVASCARIVAENARREDETA